MDTIFAKQLYTISVYNSLVYTFGKYEEMFNIPNFTEKTTREQEYKLRGVIVQNKP